MNADQRMAKARALDKRRKSIRNIRKITRTMELIATARFKKAMDRATAATAYTKRITQLVADLANSGLEVSHPLLEARDETKTADAAGAHGQPRPVRRLQRQRAFATALARCEELQAAVPAAAARNLRQARHRGVQVPRHRRRRRLHALRRQADVRRSRSAGQSLPRTSTSPASSIGSTWPTRSSISIAKQIAVGRDAAAAGLAGRRPTRSRRGEPRRVDVRVPAVGRRAFWKKSCRPASR